MDRLSLPVLEEDAQTRAGRVGTDTWSKVSDFIHVLQRTIDFTQCSVMPRLFFTTDTDRTLNKTIQYYQDYISQYSYARILLRGQNSPDFSDNLRMEELHVEGGVEMRPLSVESSTVHVLSNQVSDI